MATVVGKRFRLDGWYVLQAEVGDCLWVFLGYGVGVSGSQILNFPFSL
jgi:hypothetical protein